MAVAKAKASRRSMVDSSVPGRAGSADRGTRFACSIRGPDIHFHMPHYGTHRQRQAIEAESPLVAHARPNAATESPGLELHDGRDRRYRNSREIYVAVGDGEPLA
jgi:hypothetical protein